MFIIGCLLHRPVDRNTVQFYTTTKYYNQAAPQQILRIRQGGHLCYKQTQPSFQVIIGRKDNCISIACMLQKHEIGSFKPPYFKALFLSRAKPYSWNLPMGTKLIQNFNGIAFEKLISQRLVIQMEPNLVFLEIKKQGQNFPEQFIRQTGILKLLLHQMLRKYSTFHISMFVCCIRCYEKIQDWIFLIPSTNLG